MLGIQCSESVYCTCAGRVTTSSFGGAKEEILKWIVEYARENVTRVGMAAYGSVQLHYVAGEVLGGVAQIAVGLGYCRCLNVG